VSSGGCRFLPVLGPRRWGSGGEPARIPSPVTTTAPIRRYFDNAATSFPKPPAVAHAVARFMTEIGAPGRGQYAEAREAGRLIRTCRERIARLVGLGSPEHVVFTYNTTDALNLAIKGTIAHALRTSSGPVHVVVTTLEHNSVLRPMNALAGPAGSPRVSWTRVEADPATGLIDPADLRAALRPGATRLVCLNHASNVTGVVQDLVDLCQAVKSVDDSIIVLVDGAQSLGHIELDLSKIPADLVAFPGHKGLLGPQGTGGLCIRPGVEHRLDTIREGGTGSVSEQEVHPSMLPEKYESGSHNAAGIAGLSEGVKFLLDRGLPALRAHELELIDATLAAAASGELDGFTLLGPRDRAVRMGTFSFIHESLEPADVAAILETEYGILTRAGLHCAPLVHKALGTSPPGGRGAVRLSYGPFLTPGDVRFAMNALAEIAREARAPRVAGGAPAREGARR
jgi:cysteine desulfurase / selenocysteine lyase